MRTAQSLIRLVCPGWSESSLGTQVILLVLSSIGSNEAWQEKRDLTVVQSVIVQSFKCACKAIKWRKVSISAWGLMWNSYMYYTNSKLNPRQLSVLTSMTLHIYRIFIIDWKVETDFIFTCAQKHNPLWVCVGGRGWGTDIGLGWGQNRHYGLS